MNSPPPSEFICPLTKELMSDPMVTRYGVRFERKAIMEWLEEGNAFCPVTRNPLRISNLISDKTYQWKIKYWTDKHGFQESIKAESDCKDDENIVLKGAVPQARFLCPLTKEIMKDPMMSRHGYNFERVAIFEELETNGNVCPVSRKPMELADLISNRKLKWEIEQWQLHFGEGYDEKTQLEMASKFLKNEDSKTILLARDTRTANIIKALAADIADDVETPESESSTNKYPDVMLCLDEVIGTIQ